jgi:mannosylglycerate hydrolase
MQTLHIVSHTHWDREWYKTFQQFRLKLVHLVDNLLTLLDSDPTYLHFMLDGQTIVLEDYLQMRMGNFSRLQKYIQDNRVLIGPWYILPDEFLVSPEAIIRNLLVGKQICAIFGQRMMIGYIPDPFGHISQMPQILNGFHIDTACLWRGVSPQEQTLLHWQAPDGSQVLLAHLYHGYGNIALWPVEDPQDSLEILDLQADLLQPHNTTSHFLMMRGSDHLEPRPELPKHLAYYNEHNSKDRQAIHSTLPAYLAAASAEASSKQIPLHTINGELRNPHKAHMLPGVLSARMWIKQRNHYSQTLMERWVEPFCTWAELQTRAQAAFTTPAAFDMSTRLANPSAIIHQAWKLLLSNQPHDSICGCSIDETHRDMISRFDQVDQIGEELRLQSLRALSAQVNSQQAAGQSALAAVQVFNAAPYAKSDLVEVSVDVPADARALSLRDSLGGQVPCRVEWLERQLSESNVYTRSEFKGLLSDTIAEGHDSKSLVAATLTEENGLPCVEAEFSALLPLQLEELGNAFNDIMPLLSEDSPHEQIRVKVFHSRSAQLSFTAKEVPAFGYETYFVETAAQPPAEILTAAPGPNQEVIENEFLRVGVEGSDGGLFLEDRRTGVTYHRLNLFADQGDRGDEYNFTPPENDLTVSPSLLFIEKTVDELSQSLLLHCELELPESLTADRTARSGSMVFCPLDVTVRLASGLPALDVQVSFENFAADHRLQVRFPTGITTDFARFDSHFDVVSRPLDLPQTDASWRELPRPEAPQRTFTDVSGSDHGLMIANLGLPEAAVTRDGEGRAVIALTLLRCVGWLSRDDLWNRQGHAGPPLATPEAQEQDSYTFNYRLIPHDGNWLRASQLAHTFQTDLIAQVNPLQPGSLPAHASLVAAEPAEFLVSTIKPAEDGKGWVVRGVNLADHEINIKLRTELPAQTAFLVNLDESPIRQLNLTEGAVALEVAPMKIVTVYFGIRP